MYYAFKLSGIYDFTHDSFQAGEIYLNDPSSAIVMDPLLQFYGSALLFYA